MTASLLVFLLGLGGCEENSVSVIDRNPVPATPQGVYSVTGNNRVYVYWNGIYESDVDYYIIWRSFEPINNYSQIGTVDAQSNPNLDLLLYSYNDDAVVNGTTYYYAVSSVDHAGQVSELSAENVFDTPRPDGTVRLYSFYLNGPQSGFNLTNRTVVPYNSVEADIFIDSAGGVYYINAANIDTDLQDMGYTADFDNIGYAPDQGWSEVGYFELIAGHTYVIWTDDDHYAKMRVTAINGAAGYVDFEWAYQTDQGNLELSLPLAMVKPRHDNNYLKKLPGDYRTDELR